MITFSSHEFKTTAIYKNRKIDKLELETKLSLSEIGNDNFIFYNKHNIIIATTYNRIVYGDHGPYVEFDNLLCDLYYKYDNSKFDVNNIKNIDAYYAYLYSKDDISIKIYYQLKDVKNLPNAPRRTDGKKSAYNRSEGYADYKINKFYINPYDLIIVKK